VYIECHRKEANDQSIVFVHGLTGDSTTWSDNAGGLWPKKFLARDLPWARIMSFQYDADIFSFWTLPSQNRVGNHGQNLANVLAQLRETTFTVSLSCLTFAYKAEPSSSNVCGSQPRRNCC
jgi:hypothetical protein